MCNYKKDTILVTDGSNKIYHVNPVDFSIKKTVPVKHEYLNEIEMVKGKLWANIFTEDFIVVLDPETGIVE